MKKLLLILSTFAFITVNAQTVDEIIQKYSANLGGIAAFNKIKTVKITGSFSAQGQDFPMTIQVVNGKAVRVDVEVMGNSVISAYKDGKGWKQNQFAGAPTPTPVTAPEELNDLKTQSMMTPVLMDYKARGHQVELQGQTDVDGVKTFKIKLTSKDDGKSTLYYINSTDYNLVRSDLDREIMGQSATIETYYSDLKDFNGLKFFLTRTQKVEGQEIQTIKIDKIEFDVPIDDKIFDMPK